MDIALVLGVLAILYAIAQLIKIAVDIYNSWPSTEPPPARRRRKPPS